MSEPAWYAECRAVWAAGGITKTQLAKRFGRNITTIQRALNGNSTQWNAIPKKGVNPRISETMRQRWADPEWAAQQRLKISKGLLRSERAVGRPPKQARWDETVISEDRPQPWKPGDPKPQFLKRGAA